MTGSTCEARPLRLFATTAAAMGLCASSADASGRDDSTAVDSTTKGQVTSPPPSPARRRRRSSASHASVVLKLASVSRLAKHYDLVKGKVVPETTMKYLDPESKLAKILTDLRTALQERLGAHAEADLAVNDVCRKKKDNMAAGREIHGSMVDLGDFAGFVLQDGRLALRIKHVCPPGYESAVHKPRIDVVAGLACDIGTVHDIVREVLSTHGFIVTVQR